MLQRNILLVIGIIALFSGVMFLMLWVGESSPSKIESSRAEKEKKYILVAARPLIAGSLLRPEDMTWKELPPAEIIDGNLVRGSVSETDFVGGVTRRNLGSQEALNPNAIVKAKDRDFLSAVLSPGYRAVSLTMDAAQSISGLIMPGDWVDIVLTQNLSAAEGNAAYKSVGETLLRNRRVIAVDKMLPPLPKSAASPDPPKQDQPLTPQNASDPRTVTLELMPREAEQILVAAQIGKVALALRALEGSGMDSADPGMEAMPVWASDVSPALKSAERTSPERTAAPAGPIQKPRSLTEIIHGDKVELR
ncbi:MAG: Flp pilus assembly protein CpaB [Alphaproteobacteria bacterium]